MAHGDISPNDPRLRVNREEVERIVEDIMRPYAKKHAQAPLSDTDAAVVKSKTVHRSIITEASKEVDPKVPLDYDVWRRRLMDAYRANFLRHFTREELIEVLSVMHTEFALGTLERL